MEQLELNGLYEFDYIRECNGEHVHCIGVYLGYNEKHKYVTIGHPIDVDTNEMFAGEISMYDDDNYTITEVPDETWLDGWYSLYEDFHNEVVAEKGYDFCEQEQPVHSGKIVEE